jgi:hypothetical protein
MDMEKRRKHYTQILLPDCLLPDCLLPAILTPC